ncbi:MAG: putative rane protein [Clostridiales bacterium]|nr:putative rane protein [Clostridiales bacterium]
MNFIIECLKGVMIGIANAIPGVSGGTMMVSMGIYDKIIGSVTGFFKDWKKSIVTLLPYVIGMMVGIVGLSYGITFLLETYPFQTSLLFIGLIFGGLPILTGHVNKKSIRISHVLIFVAMFLVILLLQKLGGGSFEENAITLSVGEGIRLCFIGVIAAATMVIPGVSGSMVLMILGYYYPVLNAIKNLIHALLAFDVSGILYNLGILVPFGIGVLAGIFVIAKLIEFLLERFESHTYCGILGLVVASPIAIFMSNGIPALSPSIIGTGVLTLLLGLIVAYFLGKE